MRYLKYVVLSLIIILPLSSSAQPSRSNKRMTSDCSCRYNPTSNAWELSTRKGRECNFDCSSCEANALSCKVTFKSKKGHDRTRTYCKYAGYSRKDCGASVINKQNDTAAE